MKSTILIIFILLVTNCSNQNKTLICKDFRTGKFEFVNKKENKRFIIKRKNNYQIESTYELSTNKSILKDKYVKIIWQNDCEYKIILDTTKSNGNKTELYINSKGGLKNKIIDITGNCATIEVMFDDKKVNMEYCKIK